MNDLTTRISNTIESFNNQFFYGEKVRTYLVELDTSIILFDIPTYSSDIKTYLINKGKPLKAILSHGSCGIADGSRWQNEVDLQVYLHEADREDPWLKMKPDIFFRYAPQLDPTLEVIHTPGHTPGSVCMLEKKSGTLFTGDTVAGDQGSIRDFTPHGYNESNYGEFNERLYACASLLKYDFNTIAPFHYDILRSNAKIKLENFVKSRRKT